ncbi:MAG: hypothetical protein JOZ82_03775, partial [Marmoricola sp.]|nr:hypothetical protein [Marmoricola sp.]
MEPTDVLDGTRAFYATRVPGRGPRDLAELHAARAAAGPPAPADPPAVEELASSDGRTVPVRIHTPVGRPASGVVLELHGGGFYLGSAAASDVRDRELAEALGV